MTPARIVRRTDGGVTLTFAFDRLLIEGIKRSIPAPYRSYDPADRSWTVAPTYAGVAARLVLGVYPDAEHVDAGADPDDDAWQVLHLRPTAPPELIEAAYRCLARLHHPDRGGEHRDMLRLNAARDSLRAAPA